MHITAKNAVGIALWLLCLGAWIYFQDFAGDWFMNKNDELVWVPYGDFLVIKNILRVVVILPLSVVMGTYGIIWVVKKIDDVTHENWFEVLCDDKRHWSTKLAIAVVLASIFLAVGYGVFLVATQG